MDTFALAYLNGFSILILILVLRNYRQKFKYISREEKVFIALVFSTIAILVTGVLLKFLRQKSGITIHILLYIIQSADFILAIVISILWFYYCLFRVYQDIAMNFFLRWIAPIPAVLFAIFVAVTSPWGLVFQISQLNGYHRGPAFASGFVVGYMYIAAAAVLIITKRKSLDKGEIFPYLLILIIPVTFALLEVFVKIPISVTWATTSLVFLEIQMYVLNKKTNIDHLTNLNNRMALDSYIKRTINESHITNRCFGLVMLDIDNFKQVNDKYGHTEGDRALKAASNMLFECFSGNHFLARYGGDEFTVVIKSCDQQLMDKYLDELEQIQIRQNRLLNKPYEIKFSIGSNIFRYDEITDAHTMLMFVDKMMYENKTSKR